MSQQTNPVIIFVRGLPGSGKSHLTSKLVDDLDSQNTIVLDPDTINFRSEEYLQFTSTLSADGVDKQLHPYRFLRDKAYKGIENSQLIIWNQPFTNLEIFRKMVGRLKDHAKDNDKTLGMLLVEVNIDRPTAKQRINERKKAGGHGPSEDTFNRFHDDYVSFAGEGIKTVSVDGSDEINKSVKTVVQAIQDIQ
ncbi:MAG TPA: AAA family ATPase [Candidatus Saccharibacteria bacterium]|nr:AAA family ATPase [Candidatus Saccharibacteria bacterium]